METIRELSNKIHSRQLSPVELTQGLLERIKSSNDADHIFITITEDIALEQAARAEREIGEGRRASPLQGIPYTLKDLFKTAGVRTTGGSRVLADYVPENDAELVETLNSQSAVLLGKVNLHEFAYGATGVNPHYGTVLNPYDDTRLAGGSSSGSAAAVAKGYGWFSLGSDTGGSVRVPACLCGVAGLKPTAGLLSCAGVIPLCWSLDHVGVLARRAEDVKLVLSSLLHEGYAPSPAEEEPRDLHGLRIGIPDSFFYEDLDPEIGAALERVQQGFISLGATLKKVTLPDLKDSRTVSLTIQLPEILSYHGRYLEEKSELYSPDIFAGMTAGQFILAEQYLTAKRMVNHYKSEMRKVFAETDMLLTPSTPCVAPKAGDSFLTLGGKEIPVGNAVTKFFSLFNMTGNPSLTVPAGFHSSGLPMGFQLAGREREDETVLDAAIAYERNFSA